MTALPQAIRVLDVTKTFRYRNPDPNSNRNDMWFDYLLGVVSRGRKGGEFAPKREMVVALDRLSIEVRSGEFVGLLGPNGAGKTTLMKILSGIMLPDSGQVFVDGFDVIRRAAHAKASITSIPSANWLVFDYGISLRDNLEFWAALYGMSGREARARACRALEVVGLQDRMLDHPGALSGGMRQRFAIARGLMVATPIFLLDEPTASVDPNSARQIRDFIRLELNRKLGQTVLLATHDMAEAEVLCDRVAILHKGRLIACDSTQNLITSIPGKLVRFAVSGQTEEAVRALRLLPCVRDVQAAFGPTGTDLLSVHLVDGGETACTSAIRGVGCAVVSTTPSSLSLAHAFHHLTGEKESEWQRDRSGPTSDTA